jgi:hypothetical protein
MNVKPGGKHACMHNGWYMHNGQKIVQQMIYPNDHPTHPDKPKGINAVLMKRGLYQCQLWGKCENKCEPDKDNCYNKQILKYQNNFQEQKSLVQETIEAAGHLCIFLPKFHYELNYIEFFWDIVKKYFHDNCDYTFNALKRNLPQALHSVYLNMFRLWKQSVYR